MKKRRRLIIIHLCLFILSLFVAFYIIENKWVEQILEATVSSVVIGALIGGFFFTSTFTTVPAIATLALLGHHHNPLFISLIAAVGSALGDGILYHFIREDIIKDVEFLQKKVDPKNKFAHIFHTKLPLWIVPSIAALVIASPLPDELAVSLLGVIRFPQKYFYFFSFSANFLGILAITAIAGYSSS